MSFTPYLAGSDGELEDGSALCEHVQELASHLSVANIQAKLNSFSILLLFLSYSRIYFVQRRMQINSFTLCLFKYRIKQTKAASTR